MEPITIVLLTAAAITGIVALSAFIRQLFINRNQKIMEESQRRALAMEAKQLSKIRNEMREESTPNLHYQLLGENKEAIRYIDNRIDGLMQRKLDLIDKYTQTVSKKAALIQADEMTETDMKSCQQLKSVVDDQLQAIDGQITQLREQRKQLWTDRKDLHEKVMEKEEKRQVRMNTVYKSHTSALEKLYAKHNEIRQSHTSEVLQSGNMTFKSILMAPIRFLQAVFFPSTLNIDEQQAARESEARQHVGAAQSHLLGPLSSIAPQGLVNVVSGLFR